MEYSSLAQSVEHLTVNQGVAGSSPAGGAKTKPRGNRLGAFVLPFPLLYPNAPPGAPKARKGAEFPLKFCRREP